jgi:S-adenosyl-L-methionine hydrolase (adenosine-forming)
VIITLTTDFGLRDAYVGSMKGVILSIHPQARIIDITHDIGPQNVVQCGFVLRQAYPCFPAGSIHVAVADPGVGTERRALMVLAGGHVFLAPDNGLLESVFEAHAGAAVFSLTNEAYFRKSVSPTFHGRDVFAPSAAHLAMGADPQDMGERIFDPVRGPVTRPLVKKHGITGRILFFDHYGNAVTDIEGGMLTGTRRTEIRVGPVEIHGVSRTYADVPLGDPAALIGSHGNLEIAFHGGSAEKQAGLAEGVSVEVLFY